MVSTELRKFQKQINQYILGEKSKIRRNGVNVHVTVSPSPSFKTDDEDKSKEDDQQQPKAEFRDS